MFYGWGWFLWFGVMLLMFSSLGNWGYTYRAHRKYGDLVFPKGAMDILNERYARGEIARDVYLQMKRDVGASETTAASGAPVHSPTAA